MLAPWFALAGLACAAGPIVIHLLNRRRFRTVEWAAMDFLREATQRSRKILEWRDLLLLLLRTVAVLLFGLALAQPYFGQKQNGEALSSQPVHAVLIVDNSLSMGYEQLGSTLLQQAKDRATKLIRELAPESRISILPLCGSGGMISPDPYRSPEDALEALEAIQVVDREGSAAAALDLATEACKQVVDLSSKRVIFIGDQQLINWPAGDLAEQVKALPELQVVQVAPLDAGNAWIEEFRVQDDVADIETSTRFLVRVRQEGGSERSGVHVRLFVEGNEVASTTTSLSPGSMREIEFAHHITVPAEPGRPNFVTAKVSITPDALPADDERYLTVPVVAALPVVFVDQYGEDENPQKNLYGDTYHLRRLLAPVVERSDMTRELVQIRHVTFEGVTQSILADARLVVIAGVERPTAATVKLLRDYVRQGGQVLLAAGAGFDPRLWEQEAWLDGAGILPLPLKSEPIGRVPTTAQDDFKPFHLDYQSMRTHDYFVIQGESEESLADLYQSAYFFKCVAVDATPEAIAVCQKTDTERLTAELAFLKQSNEARQRWERLELQGLLESSEQRQKDEDARRRAEIEPAWLIWGPDVQEDLSEYKPADLAERNRPRVLASFDNHAPFLVERRIDHGRVIFASSSVFSSWNNLTRTDGVVLFARLLRMMISSTLPVRNYPSLERIVLPVDLESRRQRIVLERPGGDEEVLAVEALGANSYGVAIRSPLVRGHYTVSAKSEADAAAAQTVWQAPIAVNGPAAESNLRAITDTELRERMGDAEYAWVSQGDSISLAAAGGATQLWKWVLVLVLVCLLGEFAVLVWPNWSGRTSP